MTTKQINKAIVFLGLEIIRGQGYQYFLDAEGNQAGQSVMTCYLNRAPLAYWVRVATSAWKEYASERTDFTPAKCAEVLELTKSGPLALLVLKTANELDREPISLWESAKPFFTNSTISTK